MGRPLYKMSLLILLAHAMALAAVSQVKVTGKVYDMSKLRPLEAVSVLSTSGTGTISDSLGRYSLLTGENDSIWFSYLNKPTPKYAVKSIPNISAFEISLHVNTTELKEVRVMPPNYHLDSVQNRLDYAKAFNFQKPGIGSALSIGPAGAGLDLDEFINMFKFRRNRRMLAFQDRLVREEEERYIDHRFNRVLIIKLTQLRGAALDSFIANYRPSLEFTETSTDYEFQEYIKISFRRYQKYISLMNELKGK
jgi:hypothetical protein